MYIELRYIFMRVPDRDSHAFFYFNFNSFQFYDIHNFISWTKAQIATLLHHVRQIETDRQTDNDRGIFPLILLISCGVAF